MRILIKYAIISSFITLFASCNPSKVTINATFDKNMDLNGKWAYLFARYGNQVCTIDSCPVVNYGIRMDVGIPHEEDMVELLIPNTGSYMLLVARNEKIKIHIDSTTAPFFPQADGSFATSRMAEIIIINRTLGFRHLDSLKHELEAMKPNSTQRKLLTDSINIYKDKIDGMIKAALNNTQSALLAIVAKMWYLDSDPEVSEDSLSLVTESICRRFPSSVYLSSIDRNRIQEQPSLESIRAINRRAMIIGQPLPFPNEKDNHNPPKKIDQQHLPKYQNGDVVENILLPKVDGKIIGLCDVSTDYLLIDFWASWCTPCRREIPHIIDARKIYSNLLTVYAVSVDDDGQAWQKAINENSMENFINVRLDEKDSLFKSIIERFDVRAIPRNFLLDKDRRIIAIDLRGEALEQKMKELTIE